MAFVISPRQVALPPAECGTGVEARSCTGASLSVVVTRFSGSYTQRRFFIAVKVGATSHPDPLKRVTTNKAVTPTARSLVAARGDDVAPGDNRVPRSRTGTARSATRFGQHGTQAVVLLGVKHENPPPPAPMVAAQPAVLHEPSSYHSSMREFDMLPLRFFFHRQWTFINSAKPRRSPPSSRLLYSMSMSLMKVQVLDHRRVGGLRLRVLFARSTAGTLACTR